MEAVPTALLMLVIASVATDAREVGVPAGPAIAAVVGATSFAFGPLTGAPLNPGPVTAAGPDDGTPRPPRRSPRRAQHLEERPGFS